MKSLEPTLKFAVACFRSQYIAPDIGLLIDNGIPLVGCCYSYHDMHTGQSMIDS